jgi:KH domain
MWFSFNKLGQGVLLDVLPSLVKRRKTHFHNLPCGASIILGNNGYIWISPTCNEEDDEIGSTAGGFVQNLKVTFRNCFSFGWLLVASKINRGLTNDYLSYAVTNCLAGNGQ